MRLLLREFRKRTGLSQEDVAAALGCSHSHIAQQETGLRAPNLATIERLAREVLHCHPGELVTFPEFGILHCPCCPSHRQDAGQASQHEEVPYGPH